MGAITASMGVIMKYLRCLAALILTALSGFAAVPDYKSFIGIGGIVVSSNPPNGTIVIDGSGISAGALPSYALTNNQSTAVNLRNNLTITGTLTATNTTRLMGDFLATNGIVEIGNEGFTLRIGVEGVTSAATNHYTWYQRGGWIMNDSGQSVSIRDGAFLEVQNGSTVNVGTSGSLGTTASKIQFGTNDYITTIAGSGDAAEIQRYRFKNDNSGNNTNWVVRFWELDTNFLTSINGGTPNGSGASLHWSEITGMPAGFADGTDDGAGGGGFAALEVQTNSTRVGLQTNINFIAGSSIQLLSTNNSGANKIDLQILVVAPGSTGDVLFNQGNILAATNDFTFTRATPILVMGSVNALDATASGYEIRQVNGTNRLAPGGMLAVGATTRIYIDNGGQNLAFSSVGEDTFGASVSNQVSLGTYLAPWRTNYAQVHRAKEAVHVDGTAGLPSLIQMSATNQTQNYTLQGAHRMSVNVTNYVGTFHVSSASVIEINARQNGLVNVTNRVTGVVSLIYTNLGDGDRIWVKMVGEVSGGTSRVITIVPNTGVLVLNLDDFSASPATSMTFTLTNGNMVEISGDVDRLLGTNVLGIVTRQAKL